MNTDNSLAILENSPIEAVQSDKVRAMADRVKTLIPDGQRLTPQQALTIAQLSILTRTMPGRDVHYFLDKRGNLKMSDDYKFLRAWAVRREQFVTGDPTATFEDVYHEITDHAAKLQEGISPNDFAVYCTITTKRERENFRREVKGWLDLGFNPIQAVEMARSVLGEIGTRAIGVVNANDGKTNEDGESNRVPKGWSLMQKARKLAFKNAVHLKWGQPSIDDTQQMVRAMAKGEVIDADWAEVPLDIPAEEQARYAELNSIARQVQDESQKMTPDDHRVRLSQNHIGRNDNEAVGESDWERFVKRVKCEIPFFTTEGQIRLALAGFQYNPEVEDDCFDELAVYASRQADMKAAA